MLGDEAAAARASTVRLSLEARYDEESVLAEVVAGSGLIASLGDRYRAAPTLGVGVALGEAVAARLDERRLRDAGRILDGLSPLAVDVSVEDEAPEAGVIDVAFIVERETVAEFEWRLEELSDELSPPVRFKLTGHRPAA